MDKRSAVQCKKEVDQLPLLMSSPAFELQLFVLFELILEMQSAPPVVSHHHASLKLRVKKRVVNLCHAKEKKPTTFSFLPLFFCTGSRGSHSAVLLLDQQKVSVVFTLRLVFGTNIATCIETHSESVTGFAHCRSWFFFFVRLQREK